MTFDKDFIMHDDTAAVKDDFTLMAEEKTTPPISHEMPPLWLKRIVLGEYNENSRPVF